MRVQAGVVADLDSPPENSAGRLWLPSQVAPTRWCGFPTTSARGPSTWLALDGCPFSFGWPSPCRRETGAGCGSRELPGPESAGQHKAEPFGAGQGHPLPTPRATAPSTMPLAMSLLFRQSAIAAVAKTPSGITNTGSHPSQCRCSNFLAEITADRRRATPTMETAGTPAEIATPDANLATLFPTFFSVHSPRRSICCLTQPLAVIAMECFKIAVVPPSAHIREAHSLSMRSSSRSIALPQP